EEAQDDRSTPEKLGEVHGPTGSVRQRETGSVLAHLDDTVDGTGPPEIVDGALHDDTGLGRNTLAGLLPDRLKLLIECHGSSLGGGWCLLDVRAPNGDSAPMGGCFRCPVECGRSGGSLIAQRPVNHGARGEVLDSNGSRNCDGVKRIDMLLTS